MADLNQMVAKALNDIAQGMAYSNALLREGRDGVEGLIGGWYREAKRYVRAFDEQRGFRYRPAIITLSEAIGASGAGTDEYRVSANEDFVVQSVRGFVALQDMPSEPAVDAELGTNITPIDRIRMKANNCFVQMFNKDTKVDIFENNQIPLGAICPEAGGLPMVFNPDLVPGYIIPHNVTMQARFSLQSTNAIFTTATTTYGIMLCGLYMSREAR